MIKIKTLREMVADAYSATAIVDYVEECLKKEQDRKRADNRLRQQRFRQRTLASPQVRNALLEDRNALRNALRKFPNENNDRVTRYANPPPEPPIKESKILEFAGAKPEESSTGFGYSSFDGTVSFTAAEITKLGLDFYTLTNVYGSIRSLAESQWVASMRPQDRKRAIFYRLRKLHNDRVRKSEPDKVEQEQKAKQAAENFQDDQERALEVRKRLYGGRNAG